MRKRHIAILAGAAIALFLFVPPIRQDQSYHAFADPRSLLGIPNFWNVISNLPFALIGFSGLRRFREPVARVLFAGILLTAFGSAYYHWLPSDSRLVWDRLPMTLVFTSLFCWAAGEKVKRLLWWAVGAGVASVLWWQLTGDLRPYVLAQFGPLILLLPLVWTAQDRKYWPAILGFYILAKSAENFDYFFYSQFQVSGHACKHLLAGASAYSIFRWAATKNANNPVSIPMDNKHLVAEPQ